MLVLSRKQQDTIVIDQRIRIKVLGIRGDRIRLGIEAPEDVVILRGELEFESPDPIADEDTVRETFGYPEGYRVGICV